MKFLIVMILFTVGSVLMLAQPKACQDFDKLIEQRKVEQARLLLDAVYKENPSDYDVVFRMARLYVLLGNQEKNEDKQLELYENAVTYANKAIDLKGKEVPGYLYRAAAVGKVALFKGIFSVADEVAKVRDDCWYAIKLKGGTSGQMAGVHYILGRAHLELAYKPKWLRSPLGLGWGNIEEAHEHLLKARTLKPGFIMYELEWARCLEEMDREKEAIQIARSIESMRLREPGDQNRKIEARELVADLE